MFRVSLRIFSVSGLAQQAGREDRQMAEKNNQVF